MIADSGAALRKRREAIGLSQARLAELTNIPQYILSSFELGKSDLDDQQRTQLDRALSDEVSVRFVVKRRKRYQEHSFETKRSDPRRQTRCAITQENAAYRNLLASLRDNLNLPSRYKAISLFAGCGGLSLGFSASGFHVAGFVEMDPALAAIYSDNFPVAKFLGTDITHFSDSDIAKTQSIIGDIDAIIGGPPCQGFSLSGKRDVFDPRNSLFKHYLRFVEAYRPKIAIMENVRLLTSMRSPSGKLVHCEIEKEFQKRNYEVKMFEINAKDYGVPQHRERVFFVAVRKDLNIPPTFPRPSHTNIENDLFSSAKSYRTFADACSDLPYLESGETSEDPLHSAVAHPDHVIDWLWDVPEGFSAHDNVDPQKRPPSGYNTTYKRQIWREPGATVQTTFGMISGCRNVHPIATRSLTVREAARLQSFPDWYRFSAAPLGKIRVGIGNAVPPLLAHAVADHLSLNILQKIKISSRKIKL